MKQGRISFLRVILAGSFSACCAFLFLYAVELLITLWVSRKFHYSKVLCYIAAYLVLGVMFGIAVGIIHGILVRIGERRHGIRAGALFFALCSAGLPYLLSMISLNFVYLPQLHYFPVRLPLSLVLTISSVALLAGFYRAGSMSGDSSFPLFKTAGACCSMAAVLAVFNAFASRQVGKEWFGPSSAAALAFLVLITGTAVAAADLRIMRWLASLRKEQASEVHFRWALLLKAVVIALALLILSMVRMYRPLETEDRPAASPLAADKPNIILLVLDTARLDRLSAFGSARDTSPNIARLAEQWLVFDAYSAASWTLPAHASIFTGLYPTENGTGPGRDYRLDQRNETLAEVLQKNGYSAAAVVSNHLVLGHSTGFEQGFDYYHANSRETDPAFTLIAAGILNKIFPGMRLLAVVPFRTADAVCKEAARWIEKQSRRPFFLFINYMEPHTPYAPPCPYNRRWFDIAPPANFFGPGGIWHVFSRAVNEGAREVSDIEREYLLSQYDGEINYLDEQVGLFLDKLKASGVYDNSMIVITSDHGESFSEHGLVEHQRVLYQELIRVPLLVKLPAGHDEPVKKPTGPVSLVDLFHSVLEYVNISHEPREGSVNIFEGERSEIFCETHSVSGESGQEFIQRFGASLYSLIRGNYKLIYSSALTYEFYDLSNDPLESNNLMPQTLAPDFASALADMKARLSSHIERIQANRLVTAESDSEVDGEIRSRLKAIGYIQ